ncbi:hypothetical protein [Neolewinella antarctica]|uniref:Uncharacterized protein n=1 Tax=Neolewinella antarctica TaxID=442734 RepID=A0ABX0XD56_9BACT|nr:hypothetical protein [Neolewinella antarctica]NJC27142.1 hypothetical protein [Neolewinella antarctica]
MSTTEMRSEVAGWLENLDDEFLSAVHTIVGNYLRKDVDKKGAFIGYETDGTAVYAGTAQDQFTEDLSNPEDFITIEDFEQGQEIQAAT